MRPALLVILLSVAVRALSAQTETDIRPPALHATWLWTGVDQSLEEKSIGLMLNPDGDAWMGTITAEERAAGRQPRNSLFRWRIRHPDRSGPVLCLTNVANDGKPRPEECHSYTVTGIKPNRRLLFLDREWAEARS